MMQLDVSMLDESEPVTMQQIKYGNIDTTSKINVLTSSILGQPVETMSFHLFAENIGAKKVSAILGIVNIIIYVLIEFGMKNEVNVTKMCTNNMPHGILREFTHFSMYHLITNMVALYYVSRLEPLIGSIQMAAASGLIILISSIFTIIMRHSIPKVKCSIGFSGVILGLLAYEILAKQFQTSNTDGNGLKPSIILLVFLALSSVGPSGAKNVSVSGHLIGIMAGLLSYFIIYLNKSIIMKK